MLVAEIEQKTVELNAQGITIFYNYDNGEVIHLRATIEDAAKILLLLRKGGFNMVRE